jgi:hypothetical protein
MSAIQQLRFSDLIAPFTPEDILEFWRSRALKLQPRTGDNRFTALLDWKALWRLIEGGTIPPKECRVTNGRRIVPPLFYAEANKLNPGRLARLFEQGTSMIVVRLETYVPALSAVFRDAATDGLPIVEAGAIVTTGAGGALEAHYDPRDLIILEVEGSKRWRVYGPRVLKPVKELGITAPPQTPPILDTVLRPGDFLFMAAGYWHLCDNGPERSLHLGLFLQRPKVGADLAASRVGQK